MGTAECISWVTMQNVFLTMGRGQRKLKNNDLEDLEDWGSSCEMRKKDQDIGIPTFQKLA